GGRHSDDLQAFETTSPQCLQFWPGRDEGRPRAGKRGLRIDKEKNQQFTLLSQQLPPPPRPPLPRFPRQGGKKSSFVDPVERRRFERKKSASRSTRSATSGFSNVRARSTAARA